jgi:hypothetical protein
MHKQKKMVKLFLTVISVFVLSFEVSAQSRIRSSKILEGNWAYKTLITSGKEQNLAKKNECGFREGLSIKKSTKVQKLEFGELQFKGHQIGISDEKVCITDPVTFQPVVTTYACETTWIRLHDQPNRFLRVRQSSVVEYTIEMLNNKSMLLLKVREIYNDGPEAPEKIELEWLDRKGS